MYSTTNKVHFVLKGPQNYFVVALCTNLPNFALRREYERVMTERIFRLVLRKSPVNLTRWENLKIDVKRINGCWDVRDIELRVPLIMELSTSRDFSILNAWDTVSFVVCDYCSHEILSSQRKSHFFGSKLSGHFPSRSSAIKPKTYCNVDCYQMKTREFLPLCKQAVNKILMAQTETSSTHLTTWKIERSCRLTSVEVHLRLVRSAAF